MIFLKLGGSAITDKTRESTAHHDVIHRIAREIQNARSQNPALNILVGHGSGSFGHYAAQKSGFGPQGEWRAYAETGAAATQLTRIVTDIFIAEGIPVVAMQPSASAMCRDGKLVRLASEPAQVALTHGLVPLVFGDVSFDETRRMTVISTEMIFAYLAPILKPTRILLAGIVDGVFTGDPFKESGAQLIREITPANFEQIQAQLHGSHGYDVTGGMMGKVRNMLALVQQTPAVTVRVINATRAGMIARALVETDFAEGTLIHIE